MRIQIRELKRYNYAAKQGAYSLALLEEMNFPFIKKNKTKKTN